MRHDFASSKRMLLADFKYTLASPIQANIVTHRPETFPRTPPMTLNVKHNVICEISTVKKTGSSDPWIGALQHCMHFMRELLF